MATFFDLCVYTTLIMNNRTPTANSNEPMDETRFQKPRLKKPSPARASVQTCIRRG